MKRKTPVSRGSGSGELGRATDILERKVGRARLVLFTESFWPRLWPPFAVLALFVIVTLFGLWAFLPVLAHKALLGLFGLALLVSLVPLLRVSWPTRQQALKRLEQSSGIRHRPATAFDDTLFRDGSDLTGNSRAARLFDAHRLRMARFFQRLRVGGPNPGVERRDPFAFRAILVLTLAVAGLANWSKLNTRFNDLIGFEHKMVPDNLRLDAWVTPPDYTGKPPILLADGGKLLTRDEIASRAKAAVEKFHVPENSEFIIRMAGDGHERLKVYLVKPKSGGETGSGSADRKSLAAVRDQDEPVSEFRGALKDEVNVEIRHGQTIVARWNFTIEPDATPAITLVGKPGNSVRGALRLKYQVADDYGVVDAQASFERPIRNKLNKVLKTKPAGAETMSRRSMRVEKPLGEPPEIALKLPNSLTKSAKASTYKDLSAHPWAGLPVIMTLKARDQAGQVGTSKPLRLILPARKFRKPLAKAIVHQRRYLVANPALRRRVSRALDAITVAPEKFIKDRHVYLGLRSAYWRLLREDRRNMELENAEATRRDVMSGIVEQLWKIALRVEDGDLSDAERDLRAAQDKLMDALANNASDKEIQRLMQELRQALNRFMQALAKQAGKMTAQQIPKGLNRLVSPRDLDQMLKQIEELAKSGARDAARQMLSQMRDLLENLQAGRPSMDRRGQQMMGMMEKLGEMITRQQQLMDETFEAQRGLQGKPGQQGNGKTPGNRMGQGRGDGRSQREGRGVGKGKGQHQGQGGLGNRQTELREQLKALMGKLRQFGAQVPDNLSGAGQAMGRAGKSIDDNQLGQATQQQSMALDKLRKGAQSLAEKMLKQLARRLGQNGRNSRDPLGRPGPTQGPDLGDSVKVPDKIDIQRARQILKELRRRLGQSTRPLEELDYLDRLIERF